MSRTSEKSRTGLRSPASTTGARSPASISTTCFAKFEVEDVVGRRALHQLAGGRHVAQVRLDQREAVAQMLDVLGVTAPAKSAHHLRVPAQRELREMAAHEPRDPGDQDSHRNHTTTGP